MALRLLEERCAPYVLEGAPFDALGLDPGAGSIDWGEPRSLMAIQLDDDRWGVTDALAPFSDDERARFAAGAEALGLRLLPGSTAATPEGGATWPLFRVVAAGEPRNADAVLMVSRIVSDGDDPWASATLATLRRSRSNGG